MAEQWPFKPLVEGSIPSTLTTPYMAFWTETTPTSGDLLSRSKGYIFIGLWFNNNCPGDQPGQRK